MPKPVLIPFTDSRWQYLTSTPDRRPLIAKDGKTYTLRTKPNTDWWRMHQIPGMNVPKHMATRFEKSDGVVYGFWRKVDMGFAVQVELKITPEVQFDQACIFLYFGEHQWLKAGQEFSEGKVWDGAVVTNPYSDWSTQPVHANKSEEFTISYGDGTMRVFLGEDMLRETHVFGPKDLGPETPVFVGVMACSPQGGGAEAVFKEFKMMEGIRGE